MTDLCGHMGFFFLLYLINLEQQDLGSEQPFSLSSSVVYFFFVLKQTEFLVVIFLLEEVTLGGHQPWLRNNTLCPLFCLFFSVTSNVCRIVSLIVDLFFFLHSFYEPFGHWLAVTLANLTTAENCGKLKSQLEIQTFQKHLKAALDNLY